MNTNFQTFHQMGNAINDFVKQATGRDNVQNIDIDHVTVAQNHYYEEVDVSGPIASFMASAVVPLTSCIVQIEPIQSGSGDPSPDNVRPITGWTGANVQRAGKNLIDPSYIALANDDKYVWVRRGTGILFRKGYTYTFSIGNLHSSTIRLMTVDESTIVNVGSDKSVTYTPDEDIAVVIRVSDTNAYTFSEAIGSFQLELSSTATSYEPYQGQTYPISWQIEAGTVYGGELTVNKDGTGELVAGMADVDLGSISWSYNSNDAYFYSNSIASLNNKSNNSICSIYKNNMRLSTDDKSYKIQTNGNLVVYDSAYNNKDDFKTAMSGVQLVYELATPQTYHLTPTEIQTILGQNNIWADTGSIEVKFTDLKELY